MPCPAPWRPAFCHGRATYSSLAAGTGAAAAARGQKAAFFFLSTGHTISLYSFSKAYGFASWRVGYMLLPRHLYRPLLRIQDTNPICPPVISQFAALGLLDSGVAFVRAAMQPLKAARAYCLQELHKRQAYLATASPSGAFYFYIKLLTGGDSMQIARTLIKQYKIAVIPGAAFGDGSGCTFRVSYGAVSREHLAEGMDRLMRGLRAQSV